MQFYLLYSVIQTVANLLPMKNLLKPDIRVNEETLNRYILKYKGLFWFCIVLAFGISALLFLLLVAPDGV